MTSPFETNVTSITIFGENLLALTEDGSKLLVWSLEDEGKVSTTGILSIQLRYFFLKNFLEQSASTPISLP